MNNRRPIKLSLPHLGGKEAELATEAIESTWITPLGPYVDRFEKMLGEYLGVDHVVALSSGTAALHLALADLGVGSGDVVICQSMTFAASANPIAYLGATPVFVDSEAESWNMSPDLLRKAIEHSPKRPKAIVTVDLYGMPANFDSIMSIADEYGIAVVEDAAEALGSTYRGKRCATIGSYGVLSFNGNKMITTSGGGALICPDAESVRHVKHLATQARDNRPYYYHTELGYNYRLSNVSAAIGCAQMEVLDERISRRRQICNIYEELLGKAAGVKLHLNPDANYDSNYWLTTVTMGEADPGTILDEMAARRIETRRIWRPMHMQPIYADAVALTDGTSERIFDRGLCLPSSTTLTDEDVERVATTLIEILNCDK